RPVLRPLWQRECASAILIYLLCEFDPISLELIPRLNTSKPRPTTATPQAVTHLLELPIPASFASIFTPKPNVITV
ncbi:MAG: hypothetical protein ABL860_09570, partial [Candidatus Nitrotoga sp.]